MPDPLREAAIPMPFPARVRRAVPDAHAVETARYARVFAEQFPRLTRLLDRLSGNPALAEDLAEEALIRLQRRGEWPESPEAWLVTVALNLLRNAKTTEQRRRRLFGWMLADRAHADPPAAPDTSVEAEEERRAVRRVLERLPERDRQLLLLHAEGYAYQEIAGALALNPASVGTLLVRARQAFGTAWSEVTHAS